MSPARLVGAALALALGLAGCGTGDSGAAVSAPLPGPAGPPPMVGPSPAPAAVLDGGFFDQRLSTTPSSVASLIRPLGSSLYDPSEHVAPTPPVSLTIDGIPVDQAPVVPVGVRDNGELDVPPASQVGWYEFGPAPGQHGSAVLAAHIAANGRNGVFRHLDQVELGSEVIVGYADGASTRFEVVATAQYPKTELPFDELFTGDGSAMLTLITCGGDFNPSVGSYLDNVVVRAVPLGP